MAAVLVAVAVVGVGIVVRTAGRSVISGFMEGNSLYGRLPAEQRSAFEERIKAAVGKGSEGMSQADANAMVERLMRQGMPLLDDSTLVTKLEIQVRALGTVDTAACAAFGRASMTGKADRGANEKVVSAIPDGDLAVWFETSVKALEVAAASPNKPAPTVDPAVSERVYNTIFSSFPAAQQEAFAAFAQAPGTTSDADACSLIRLLYGTGVALAPADRAVLARIDVSQ